MVAVGADAAGDVGVEAGDDDVGSEGADDADDVGRDFVLVPDSEGFVGAFGEAEVEGAGEELLCGIEVSCGEEFVGADESEFLAELGATRERGYAVDDGEFEDYVNCVAAPVRDASGQTVAAVSVTALKARADLTALRDLVPALLGTADSISKELGHRP